MDNEMTAETQRRYRATLKGKIAERAYRRTSKGIQAQRRATRTYHVKLQTMTAERQRRDRDEIQAYIDDADGATILADGTIQIIRSGPFADPVVSGE